MSKITAQSNDEFILNGANWMKEKIQESIKQDGVCLLGLSGGTTPKPIYEKLGEQEGIDWAKVWIFAVDERYIPRDHKDANFRLVTESLLKNKAIPADHVVFPDPTLPLDACIADYDSNIKKLLAKSSNGAPHVLTLGLGDDGHFASLFPNMPAELQQKALDTSKAVIHTTTETFAIRDRITITFKPIADSHHRVFFLKGANKEKVWDEMVAAKADLGRWPPQKALEKPGCAVVVFPA